MYKKKRKIEGKRRDNENKLKQQLRCPLPQTNEEPHGGVQIIYNFKYVRYLHDM